MRLDRWLDRPRVIALVALAVVVLLFAGSTVAGLVPGGPGSGGGGVTAQTLPDRLGDLFVRPASPSDVKPTSGGCASGGRLTIKSGTSCDYDLATGFLAKKLRLRFDASGSGNLAIVGVVLLQPDPRSRDVETMDDVRTSLDLTYRESGSRLTLTCVSLTGHECLVGVA